MTDEEKEALADAIAAIAEDTCAIRDVLTIIGVHLSRHTAAGRLAEELRAIATAGELRPTARFSAFANELADALEQKTTVPIRSLGSPPPRLDREELRSLLRVLPGGPNTA